MKGARNSLYHSHIVVAGTLSVLALLPAPALAQASPPAQNNASAPGGAYTPNPRAVSLYNLGLTAHKQGSPESAIIFFKRACDLDPNLADARYNLGVLYQMQKRYKEAIPRFEEVLRIKPTDPDAHFQLAVILQDSGRMQEAREHFSAIAPNNSHFREAQTRLAQINSGSSGVGESGQATNPPALATREMPGSYSDNSALTPNTNSQPQMSANQQPAQQAPTAVAQQVPLQPSGMQSQPATAYIPPNSPSPPVSTGPVPVMANATLRIIATGFSAPSGLAFDRNGNLYVANYMTNSIDRIGQDGSRNTFCTGINLRGPIGLVVDDANNLYVANYISGTVVKVSPAGISTVVASGFKKPYYLTLDKDSNLYVSQQEDNSIVRIVLPRTLGSRAQ